MSGIPPKCLLCPERHWPHQAHRFGGGVSKDRSLVPVSHKEVGKLATQDMANTMANTYRYRDEEKRKRYQRVLMQLRRAIAKGLACSWPKETT